MLFRSGIIGLAQSGLNPSNIGNWWPFNNEGVGHGNGKVGVRNAITPSDND